MSIEIKDMPRMNCIAVRHVGPYHTMGRSFGKLDRVLRDRGIQSHTWIGYYFDDVEKTPPDELRSDCCAVLPAGAALPEAVESPEDGEVHLVSIPAGRYAVWHHVGPYTLLGEAWRGFMCEMETEKIGHPGPFAFEIYVDDVERTAPERLRTDLYEPVSP